MDVRTPFPCFLFLSHCALVVLLRSLQHSEECKSWLDAIGSCLTNDDKQLTKVKSQKGLELLRSSPTDDVSLHSGSAEFSEMDLNSSLPSHDECDIAIPVRKVCVCVCVCVCVVCIYIYICVCVCMCV
jgi:hypothetical protein